VRQWGGILLVSGILGFLYCSSRLSSLPPLPEGEGLSESLRHPSGPWEVGRYATAFAAGVGLLLFLFPKGR